MPSCPTPVAPPFTAQPRLPAPPTPSQLPPIQHNSPFPIHKSLHATLINRYHQSRLRALTLPPASPAADFSSNDFLSLSMSPLLRTQFTSELSCHPHPYPLASGGSRLLDGNSQYAEELEKIIAEWHRADAALLFNSGYEGNTGFFSSMMGQNDAVLYDEYVHASVHMGIMGSRVPPSRKRSFSHNCLDSFTQVLGRLVSELLQDRPQSGRNQDLGNIFVAVEGVYSMDGDVTPLQEMIQIADRVAEEAGWEKGRVLFVVDEAHATGVIGDGGRGLVCGLGLEERVFARLVTFGKALAGNGAAILCTPLTRAYLLNYSKPTIYTTFLSFPALALIKSSYSLLTSGILTPLQASLRNNIFLLHKLLLLEKFPSDVLFILPRLKIPCEREKDIFLTPILALVTPQPRSLARILLENGYLARPIVWPTIPKGKERVRICVHSGNTEKQVIGLVQKVREWVRGEGGRLVKERTGKVKL